MEIWRDATQIQSLIESQYDTLELNKLYSLYALHFFLYGALPRKDQSITARFEEVIFPSEYGQEILSTFDVSLYNATEISLALLLILFHRHFLVDVRKSDANSAMK